MPATRCPHCDRPLTPDEGQAAACPGCGQPLASPVTAIPPPPIQEGIRGPLPESLVKRPARSLNLEKPNVGWQFLAWATVRGALALYGTGSVLVLIGLLIEAALKSQEDIGDRKIVLPLLAFVAQWAGWVLVAAGIFMATVVPDKSAAKGTAMGAAGCLIAGFLTMLLWIAEKSSRQAAENYWVNAAIITFMFGKILFTVFLWRVALHLREPTLASNVLAYLAVDGGLGVILLFLRNPTESILAAPINPLTVDKGWVLVIVGTLLWSVVLVFMVRERITRMLLGPRHGEDEQPPQLPPGLPERSPERNSPSVNQPGE